MQNGMYKRSVSVEEIIELIDTEGTKSHGRWGGAIIAGPTYYKRLATELVILVSTFTTPEAAADVLDVILQKMEHAVSMRPALPEPIDADAEEKRILALLATGYALTKVYPDKFQIYGYGRMGLWPEKLVHSMIDRGLLSRNFELPKSSS